MSCNCHMLMFGKCHFQFIERRSGLKMSSTFKTSFVRGQFKIKFLSRYCIKSLVLGLPTMF